MLESLTRRPFLFKALAAALLACALWTAAHGALYPNNPLSVPLSRWPQNAFKSIPAPAEFQMRDQLARILPVRSRVLSDSAYLHAALADKGIEVVPVWSPEVRFIFSETPENAEHRLRSIGIGSVAYYPQSLNASYLIAASPFYASLPRRWRVLAQAPGLNILVP